MSKLQSIWAGALPTMPSDPLTSNTNVDVCIIGAGIAGLTAAYRLLKSGRRVTLLDAKTPGHAETAYTTAHLAWAIDDRFTRLAEIRGDEVAKLAAVSHQVAISDIQDIAKVERIECEFARVPGYLFSEFTDSLHILEEEEKTLNRLNIAHRHVDAIPLFRKPGIAFPEHARFHPGMYLSGLLEAVQRLGGVVKPDTSVVKITGGSPCTIETETGYTITARAVVVATNVPFDAGLILHTRIAAYTTYAIAIPIANGSVPDALYWDTEDPYHYVRILPASVDRPMDLLIVGGEDHKTGQAKNQLERWSALEAWAKSRIPNVGKAALHWSGQVFETLDGLGLIGRGAWGENVFVMTGDSGMGLTHGTLGGRLIADLVNGVQNPWEKVYDPNRWTVGAALTMLQENSNLAMQYADWFTGGDLSDEGDIAPGQGAIVRRGLRKIAVHRKPDGSICELSATCPHLGAVVRWNPGEQTWDCPAHGSRFTATGEVMHGPAVSGLEPEETPGNKNLPLAVGLTPQGS